MRAHAHVHHIALDQDGGIHQIRLRRRPLEDGQIGAVGRGGIDLVVEAILRGDHGARMADHRQRLFHCVAHQVDDSHRAILLIGRIRAAAVVENSDAGRIVAHRNRVCGSERRPVIAIFVKADVDDADRSTVIIGDNQFVGRGIVFGVNRAGDCAHARGAIGRRDAGCGDSRS